MVILYGQLVGYSVGITFLIVQFTFYKASSLFQFEHTIPELPCIIFRSEV